MKAFAGGGTEEQNLAKQTTQHQKTIKSCTIMALFLATAHIFTPPRTELIIIRITPPTEMAEGELLDLAPPPSKPK